MQPLPPLPKERPARSDGADHPPSQSAPRGSAPSCPPPQPLPSETRPRCGQQRAMKEPQPPTSHGSPRSLATARWRRPTDPPTPPRTPRCLAPPTPPRGDPSPARSDGVNHAPPPSGTTCPWPQSASSTPHSRRQRPRETAPTPPQVAPSGRDRPLRPAQRPRWQVRQLAPRKLAPVRRSRRGRHPHQRPHAPRDAGHGRTRRRTLRGPQRHLPRRARHVRRRPRASCAAGHASAPRRAAA